MSNSRAFNAGTTVFIHARIIDAHTVIDNGWLLVRDGVIADKGEGEFTQDLGEQEHTVVDARGNVVSPGYIDIHSHGGWASAFDDGNDAISQARTYHMLHGTTRHVLSLITNPWEVLLNNVREAANVVKRRTDIVGLHLEGPFLSVKRKGAHDENCLLDPTPERVEELLDAADGTLRQITIAPELEHGLSAIEQFAHAGVNPAVGHCDADYDIARTAFARGASIMTHMFNAMNGISHRAPGPIPAASENSDVTIELIADGFHVQVPVLRAATHLAPHRIALVTDSMAAAGCPDGSYLLGNLEVDVVDTHARLRSNGAIAGSALNLEEAVQRMIFEVGMSAQDAIEAATWTPARALGLDKVNKTTEHPVGLLEPGYSADVLLLNQQTMNIIDVWCDGIRISECVREK
ncbi:N-acetylglucosamine-6-phosphate deacetylase [Alloscardovia theropitheci]|uniref:N-acetylglucosamine-6-phosphate deacetylase n=1 Tax=Alloscardovia theropitheci TaxID=2496842 RepID=A0A4R0QQ51_9BIFI|nr:N-acetylglucosamine-6-phosphate deacetylase [Alloscardovia theropitheci]TCD54403.1 N-acetylglucosamine-6-phosphate deacetylase [Alloscardovia theropitheci]